MTALKKDQDRWFIDRMTSRADKHQQVKSGLRRAYILPTQKGFYYAMTLLVMLVWSINYALSLGYAVTFFVGIFALVVTVLTVMNLSGIQITALDKVGNHADFFAGDKAYFRLQIDNQKIDPSIHIEARRNGIFAKPISLNPTSNDILELPLDDTTRGIKTLQYVRLSSDYPIGLFRSWTWFYFTAEICIYPAPKGDLPLPFHPEHQGIDEGQVDLQGSEDFADLRDYRAGDNLRHIVWKKAALGQVSVKTFQALAGQECILDFNDTSLNSLNTEQRLSQLCAWVQSAEQQGTRYCLQLPNRHIDFGLGLSHRAKCLEALACY